MKTRILLLLAILLVFLKLQTSSCFAQITFVHITDLHIADGLSAGDYDLNGAKFSQMQSTIENLNPKPAFVVASGDISHAGNGGPSGMFPAITQHLFPANITNPVPGQLFIDSLQTIPIYFTPGNHDYRTGNVPPLSNSYLQYYSAYIAPDTDYVVVTTDAVILFMRSGYDDNRSIIVDTNPMNPEGSGFTVDQLNWIRDTLTYYSNKRKIIIMHHPAVDVAGTNSDGTPFTGTILDTADGSLLYNRMAFLNICDSNKVDVVLTGHEHQNVVADSAGNVVSESWKAGTRYVQTGSCMFGSYRIITIYPDSVSVGPPQLSVLTNIDNQSPCNNFSFDCYYDPGQHSLFFYFGNQSNQVISKLRIYNIIGQELFEKDFNLIDGNQFILSSGDIPKGLYTIVLQTGERIITKKIIIN